VDAVIQASQSPIISKRYVTANNKYMENYDKTKDSNYLMYLDANNLYGWAMSQNLPYDEVKINNDINIKQVLETSDDNDTGYIVECNLRFPKEIHEKRKQYPPAPESLTPKDEWLSPYQMELKEKLNVKSSTTKLIPHLMDHNNYCIHYRNLKYIVDLGVEIKQVHNIVSFKQKPWLKPYIDFNTKMTKDAKK
jgi:hypothetical protein